jgi:FAD:protein FMN transferase
MIKVAVARNAMATRFEILLFGENVVALRAAGEEALDEIERLEGQLSLYRPSSELSNINACAATRSVRVEPKLFRLLQRAQRWSVETGGAFDVTIAPLMKCWGFMRGPGNLPDLEELKEARSKVGMQLITFNEDDFTVRFQREGVMIDLGSIGKGYALERGAEILADAGVASALLQGGTSSAYAIGKPPEAEAWNIAIERPNPNDPERPLLDSSSYVERIAPHNLLAVVPLRNESLSVSAVWGKSFAAGGKTYGHVIDPRIGRPVDGPLLAAVALASATESDALSTALLTLGPAGIDQITKLRPGMRGLIVSRVKGSDSLQVQAQGIEIISGTG